MHSDSSWIYSSQLLDKTHRMSKEKERTFLRPSSQRERERTKVDDKAEFQKKGKRNRSRPGRFADTRGAINGPVKWMSRSQRSQRPRGSAAPKEETRLAREMDETCAVERSAPKGEKKSLNRPRDYICYVARKVTLWRLTSRRARKRPSLRSFGRTPRGKGSKRCFHFRRKEDFKRKKKYSPQLADSHDLPTFSLVNKKKEIPLPPPYCGTIVRR